MYMHHVAIMKKSWNLIPKIISGEKSIESRWYKTRRLPWGKIEVRDTVFFKNSGEKVVARATVLRVMQLELAGLGDSRKIIKRYGKKICLINDKPETWNMSPRYCILLQLGSAKKIQNPFNINKKGFGMSTAWITVPNIESIKI